MPSRARAIWLMLIAIVCVGAFAAPTVSAAPPDEDEILDALEAVREDPNLSAQRTVRTLKWAGEDRPDKPREPSNWLEWIAGLFQWIAGASRLILWIGAIVLIGLLALFLKRVLSGIHYRKSVRLQTIAPTHVRELDIRPESLPDQIGAAALSLWERNDHRAALALLYRGLLSRLVHSHGVPIRESMTEADCLRLAVPRLQAENAQYTSMLVRVWQHAVYGAREPVADEVRALCTHFDRSFPAPAVGGPS